MELMKCPNIIYRCDQCLAQIPLKKVLSDLNETVKDLTKTITPRVSFIQEKVQKLEKTAAPNQLYSARVKQYLPEQSTQQNEWKAKNSFVVNKIKDFNDTRDSSKIKTTLSRHFPQTKFLHTMKTADGRIIVETDNESTAETIVQNWPKELFGGSECRRTVQKQPLTLLLKGVPLPEDISDTGIPEEDLQNEIQQTFPECKVLRVTRTDNSPIRMLKIIMANEEDAQTALQKGICIGSLWIHPEVEQKSPKVIQCYKCLKFGHISASCMAKQITCSICAQDGHDHKHCTQRHSEKCKNCSGTHIAVSRFCPIKVKKLEELCIRKEAPLPNWLAKLKQNERT